MEYCSQKSKDVSVLVNGLQMLGKMFQWVRHQDTYVEDIRREQMKQPSENVLFNMLKHTCNSHAYK